MTEVLGRSAGIAAAGRPSLVLPVDIHQQEETEGDYREKRFQEITSDGDQSVAESVEPRHRQEDDHDRFSRRRVA